MRALDRQLRAAVGTIGRRDGLHRDAHAVLRAARADRLRRGRPRAGHRASTSASSPPSASAPGRSPCRCWRFPSSVIIGAPLSGWLLGMSQAAARSRAGASCSWPRPCPTLLLGLARAVLFSGHDRRSALAQSDEKATGWRGMPRVARTATRANDWSVLRQPLIAAVGPAVVLPAVRFLRRDLLAAAGDPVAHQPFAAADRIGGRAALDRRRDRHVCQRRAFGSQWRTLLAHCAARRWLRRWPCSLHGRSGPGSRAVLRAVRRRSRTRQCTGCVLGAAHAAAARRPHSA